MIAPADENFARRGLLLEMALQAKVGIPLREHLVVHRSVRIMAGGATFARGLMLEDEWAALRDMTLGASVGLAGEIETTSFNRVALVRVMTVAAAHLAIFNRMVVWQLETSFHLQVTGEAHLW